MTTQNPFLVFGISLLLSQSAHAALNMKEGMWEFNNPGGMTTKTCFKSQDLKDVQSLLSASGIPQQCKWRDIRQTGNTAKYTLECTYGWEISVSDVTHVFMDNEAKVTMKSDAGPAVNRNGRRVGPCH